MILLVHRILPSYFTLYFISFFTSFFWSPSSDENKLLMFTLSDYES